LAVGLRLDYSELNVTAREIATKEVMVCIHVLEAICFPFNFHMTYARMYPQVYNANVRMCGSARCDET